MPIDPIVGGALISTGGSALANAFQNAGNKRQSSYQNRKTIQFWRMQNEYNSPTAQMARLKEAGLNPNLIYGGSPGQATGNADRPGSATKADIKVDNPLSEITRFADIKQRNAQTDNLKEQNDLIRKEGLLKNAQTIKVLGEGSSARTKAIIDKTLMGTSIQLQKENLRNIEQGTIERMINNTIKSQSIQNLVKDIFYRVENAKATLDGQRLKNELMKHERDLNKLGIQKNDNLFFRIFGKNYNSLIEGYKSLDKSKL